MQMVQMVLVLWCRRCYWCCGADGATGAVGQSGQVLQMMLPVLWCRWCYYRVLRGSGLLVQPNPHACACLYCAVLIINCIVGPHPCATRSGSGIMRFSLLSCCYCFPCVLPRSAENMSSPLLPLESTSGNGFDDLFDMIPVSTLSQGKNEAASRSGGG